MKYGKYKTAPDKGIETEATECILTGAPLAHPFDDTVREPVSGTPYFYRVLSSQYHRVTDELRAQWRSEAPRTAPVMVTRSGKADKEVKE